jgi:hypothetical protein
MNDQIMLSAPTVNNQQACEVGAAHQKNQRGRG